MQEQYMVYCQECKKETLHYYEEFPEIEYDEMGNTLTFIMSLERCVECGSCNTDQLTKPNY